MMFLFFHQTKLVTELGGGGGGGGGAVEGISSELLYAGYWLEH